MSRRLISIVFSMFICVASALAQQGPQPPLTNGSVVKLVKAGFKEKTVIAVIGNRPSVFDLEPEQLIELKRQGVSENIILAMLASQDATFVIGDDEELSDDAFFKGPRKPNTRVENSNGGDALFGSSGSSQSQRQSSTGQGGKENEGSVTGSATVRIIKPPVEAGDRATPKLEKTPALNNEGIVRLVEAGFSEGTIIKRIEESPVDFDLSPPKLSELQKRRVTDAIIAAMSAAMGNDPRP